MLRLLPKHRATLCKCSEGEVGGRARIGIGGEERKQELGMGRKINFFRSIIIVGVGDGPFGVMEKFDDEIPTRKFDNLQFVNFYNMTQYSPIFDVNFGYTSLHFSSSLFFLCSSTSSFPPLSSLLQIELILVRINALMEIPDQYQAIKELHLLD